MSKLHTFVAHPVQERNCRRHFQKTTDPCHLNQSIEAELYRFEGHFVCSESVKARALFHFLKYRYLRAAATRIGRKVTCLAKAFIFSIDMYL